jgi:hypothetical protein
MGVGRVIFIARTASCTSGWSVKLSKLSTSGGVEVGWRGSTAGWEALRGADERLRPEPPRRGGRGVNAFLGFVGWRARASV